MNRSTSFAGAVAATFMPGAWASNCAQRDDQALSGIRDIARAVPNPQRLALAANPSTFRSGLHGGSEQLGDVERIEPLRPPFRLD